jgi:hypothetical protein
VTEPQKGVVYAPPPPDIFPTIASQIDEFIKGLPEGDDAMFHVGLSLEDGINGAFVARREGRIDFKAVTWIGKRWSEPLRGGVFLVGSWNWKDKR